MYMFNLIVFTDLINRFFLAKNGFDEPFPTGTVYHPLRVLYHIYAALPAAINNFSCNFFLKGIAQNYRVTDLLTSNQFLQSMTWMDYINVF